MGKSLLLLILISTAWAQDETCVAPKADVPLLESLADDSLPVLQKQLGKDIAAFCKENVYRGVASVLGKKYRYKEEYLRNGALLAADVDKARAYADGWTMSMFPAEETGLKVLEDQLGKDLIKGAQAQLKEHKSDELTEGELNRIRNPSINMASDLSAEGLDYVSHNEDITGPECEALTVSAKQDCVKGLKELPGIIDLKGPVSLTPVFKKVLTDPTYLEGTRRAALKMVQHAQTPGAPAGNYFDDLYSSFIESGLSPEMAHDHTWNIIGLVATGGPNTFSRLEKMGLALDVDLLKKSIIIISKAIPYLDAKSAASGNLYSYPKNVKATCNQGKPYHFWMSAFLARELSKNGGSPEGNAAATFVIQKGYQLFGSKGHRDPKRALKVPENDPFNHVMRMDLAYAAAGAHFGARSVARNESSPLDVDTGISKLVIQRTEPGKEKGILKRLGISLLPAVLQKEEIEEVYRPNEAFRHYSK